MNHLLQSKRRPTRIAVIERPDGTYVKRAFTYDDVETAQLAAIFWLEETWRPRIDRFVAIVFPEFDIWPGAAVSAVAN